MKKYSILLGAAFSLFALASCQKEVDVQTPETENANKHIPFVLKAEIPQTRTTLDADTWEMAWEDGDVIYAVTTDEEWGVAFGNDNDGETIANFTYSNGTFEPDLSISDGTHTFNFLYTANESQRSYHRGAASSYKLLSEQTEDAQAPTAAVKMNDALVGQVEVETPTTFVNVPMKHLFTLMKVTLKNRTGEAITVNKFEMQAAGATLAGVFNVVFGENPSVTLKQSGTDNISVDITNGAIAAGEELPVFFVMAPLSNYSGDITFRVFDASGNTYTKKNTVEGVTFNAGEYNTASYSLKTTDPVECVTLDWIYPASGEAASKNDIMGIPGVTAVGLGDDYGENHSPYCIKFDNTNDYIQVRTDKAIGKVSVKYKMIGGSTTSTLEIFESADGTNWAKVEDLSIAGAQNSIGEVSTTAAFNDASRLVKINFKKGSNVGIGGITIERKTTWILSGINVATAPTKTQYIVGQSFDPDGMVITADYVDADDDTHTKLGVPVTDYTYSPTGALAISDNEITITYSEGGVTVTAKQAITVSELPTNAWVETALSELGSSDVFVIVGDDQYALPNDGGTTNPEVVEVTVSGNILTGTIPANLKWTVSGDATNGYTFYPNGSSSTWLYCSTTAASGSNTNIRVGTGDRKLFKLNSDNYLVTADTYTDRYLSIYVNNGSAQDWRGYTSASSAAKIKFYKYTGTTVTVATPTFSVAEGTYTSAQSVEISCATSGATIYYTLDGSTPDNTKSVYSGALSISATTTVKAIAIKDGVSSAVASATYTISGGGGTANTLEFTVASHEGWDVSEAEDKNSYYLLYLGKSISSPSISVSEIKSIAITMRTFGGTDANKVTIYYGNTEIGSATTTKGSTLTEVNAVLTTTTVSGPAAFRIVSAAGNQSSKGEGISKITIKYN